MMRNCQRRPHEPGPVRRWDGPRRVHSALIHSWLRDGKVWIEADGTEEGVAPSLQARGVAKHDIVLAFYSETKRKYTEFAVA